MVDNPITRKEKYLAKLTGSYTGNVPDPITRVEKYLYDLCQKGISGLTPEEIENAVNKYLEGKDYVTKTDADKAYQPAGSYLSGTDEDLAVSGKAADAKAVGNAVAKIEGINYTDRGTLADTDAFLVNDGTGMKKSALSKLSDWVIGKIANKVFENLQTQNKTILGALNELNSNVFVNTQNLSTFSVNIRLNKNNYTSFLMYGATSQNNGFMYIIFIDTSSEKRAVNFIKIADVMAGRTFSGTYSDDTSTLTINSSNTIWGGIKLLMFKGENY